MSPGRRRRALLLAAVALLAALTGIVGWKARWTVKNVMRTTAAEGGLLGVRVARPTPDATVEIAAPGPVLSADIYHPPGGPEAARSALLLVHGNRLAGAGAPLYRLLARQFADAGCLVLAPSLRGFGASAPAPDGRPVTAADLRDDVDRALQALDRVAPPGIPRGVAGHSLGALLALWTPGEPGLRAVAIEPGRRLRERVWGEPGDDLDEFVVKLSRNLRGGVKNRQEVRALYRDLDFAWPSDSPLAPALILQGAGVAAADLRSIELTAEARPDCDLAWLESTDHDFGVHEEVIQGRKYVFYPGKLTKSIVGTTLEFVERNTTPLGVRGRESS